MWRQVLEVNLTGTYLASRSCLPSTLRSRAMPLGGEMLQLSPALKNTGVW